DEAIQRASRCALLELTSIAGAELFPARGLMAVPPAQLVAGGNVPTPLIDRDGLAADAARPEPIDEDALAVVPRRRVICATYPDPIAHALSVAGRGSRRCYVSRIRDRARES